MTTTTPRKPKAPEAAGGPKRRTGLIVTVIVLALAAVGLGTWAIVEATQTDDLEVATEWVGRWTRA